MERLKPVQKYKGEDIVRQCIVCSIEIKACMGFVLARDIINIPDSIREICGKCGLMFLEMNETQLIKYISVLVA
jgi:hypothetical protein